MLLLQINPDFFIDTGEMQGIQKQVVGSPKEFSASPLSRESLETQLGWAAFSFTLSLQREKLPRCSAGIKQSFYLSYTRLLLNPYDLRGALSHTPKHLVQETCLSAFKNTV